MKYAKSLGLLAAAAAVLMAFAAAASADTATSPTGTTYTGTIRAEAEGHTVLDNPIAKIECASTIEGTITGHGAGKPVSGSVSTLDFTNCTNEWHVTTVSGGTFSIDNTGATITVTSSGATFEATRLGVTCRYATNNTLIGRLTNSESDFSSATMHVVGIAPFESGSFLCGENMAWTGSYKVVKPIPLTIDNN